VSSLGDRLRRLRRPDAGPVPVPERLDAAETSLLGGVEDGLTLKERLELLVAATTARSRGRRSIGPPTRPLEEIIEGQRIQNDHGEFFLVESDLHLETRHGEMPLSRFRTLVPGSVGILTGEAPLDSFDLTRAVFLDTETTGLAGGTGTAAFLVGLGFVEGDRFRVRQYFMRDYHEEPALLAGLAEDLGRFPFLVTFNGKMFDVPLLETRFRLDRGRFPLSEAPHLDLLHPARRLWKARLESCRLQTLESEILGVRRRGDVPGEAIPGIYFDYVRGRGAEAMARVLEHNRLDIVSLAALAVEACRWIEEGAAEDPRDVLSLARVLERARLYERSEAAYRRAVACDRGALRTAALVRLASRAKRAGDHARAADLWAEAAASGDLLALRELAIHHEHRSRDLAASLAAVERGLVLVEGRPGSSRLAADFARRRERIRRRMSRGGGGTAARRPAPPRTAGGGGG
jgi:uncharacterized protein YprB with RNaseH-like and TPR domain